MHLSTSISGSSSLSRGPTTQLSRALSPSPLFSCVCSSPVSCNSSDQVLQQHRDSNNSNFRRACSSGLLLTSSIFFFSETSQIQDLADFTSWPSSPIISPTPVAHSIYFIIILFIYLYLSLSVVFFFQNPEQWHHHIPSHQLWSGPQEEMSAPPGLVVAGIDLNNANLQGSLVKELSLLSDMYLFHLNSNRFTGTVPETFRKLSSLSELDLSNNHFSGPFPSVTLLLPNLIYLDLRFNNFSGPIPEDLFDKNLDAIFLNNNQFEGQIPLNLGSSPASAINLANNKFSGNIPPSFGYMGPALKEVLLLNNQLTGCIPEGVGFLTEMEVLDVSFNSLTGHLPNSISSLNEIEVLNLAHNNLSGVLPDLVCSLRNLINLTLAYNFFSGFSQECTKLFFRNVGFDFSLNCIPDKDMQRPPPECSVIPGGGLNCLRIPLTRPILCAPMVQTPETTSGISPYLLSPSISPP